MHSRKNKRRTSAPPARRRQSHGSTRSRRRASHALDVTLLYRQTPSFIVVPAPVQVGGRLQLASRTYRGDRRFRAQITMLRSALLNVMIKAAQKASRALKRDFGEVENLQVSLKGPANFVTAADRRAEEILRQELAHARPGYSFLGEEGGLREGADKTHRWIVDPLDGTMNFLHGIPHFAISIALEREGTIVAGIVYNPANDELFTAERGKGAVVTCALPHPSRGDVALTRKEHMAVQDKVAGLRRFGAAALDLAWVAAGRLDAYWERNLSPWDMAAGIALVREAGGFVSDLDGGEAMLSTGDILAGNEAIHRDLLRALAEART